jgi:hypothetical protein
LLDEGLIFQAVIDGFKGIFDREDKTGRELLEASDYVYQHGRVRKIVKPGHAIVPALCRMGQPACGSLKSFSLCGVVCAAPEWLIRRLDDRACSVLGQIPPTNDDVGMS